MNISMYIFIYTYICLSVLSNFAATRSRHFPSVPPPSLALSIPLSPHPCLLFFSPFSLPSNTTSFVPPQCSALSAPQQLA